MNTKKTLDKAIKTCDADISKNDVKRIYSLLVLFKIRLTQERFYNLLKKPKVKQCL